MMRSILIVEDDITFGMMLKTWLGKKGFEVSSVSTIARARKHIESQTVDLILSDLRLPDHEGIDLLKWMNEQGKAIPLIIMTGYADIQSAVLAMKLGARDYIAKPVNPGELLKKISEALQSGEDSVIHNTAKSSSKKGPTASSKDSTENNCAYLEGESDAAKQLYNYVGLVAPTNMSVLINGSSGTGKEYVAHRIHQLSKRSDKPFVAVDCGSIPKELAASEFFGHVKGAFTGAVKDTEGYFGKARGGTLFLDEIGNMSYEMQVLLLRVLQEKVYSPVGSRMELEADVRILSATNEDMGRVMQEGRFREDLYYRLAEFEVCQPSLAECPEDILPLADFFRRQYSEEMRLETSGFTGQAEAALLSYSWPGNVRQLANRVRRAVLLAESPLLSQRDLGLEGTACEAGSLKRKSILDGIDEKERICRALEENGNNISRASEALGMSRPTFYKKMEKYGLK